MSARHAGTIVVAIALFAACSSKTKTRGGSGGSGASGGASGSSASGGAGGSSASGGAGGSSASGGAGASGSAGSTGDAGTGDAGKTLAELCAECVAATCTQEAADCTAVCTNRRNCIVSECAFATDIAACANNACSTSASAQKEYAALESCVCNSACKQHCDGHMKNAPGFIVCPP